MTVYAVQEEAPGQNILTARDYGDIVYLLPRGQVTFSASPHSVRFLFAVSYGAKRCNRAVHPITGTRYFAFYLLGIGGSVDGVFIAFCGATYSKCN